MGKLRPKRGRDSPKVVSQLHVELSELRIGIKTVWLGSCSRALNMGHQPVHLFHLRFHSCFPQDRAPTQKSTEWDGS